MLGLYVIHLLSLLLLIVLKGLILLLAELLLFLFNPFTLLVVLFKLLSKELFSLNVLEFEFLCHTIVHRLRIVNLVLLYLHSLISSYLHLHFVILEAILYHLYFLKLLQQVEVGQSAITIR